MVESGRKARISSLNLFGELYEGWGVLVAHGLRCLVGARIYSN